MGRGLQPDCGGPGARRVPLVPTTSQPKQRHFRLLDKHSSPVALGKRKEDVQQPGPNTQSHPSHGSGRWRWENTNLPVPTGVTIQSCYEPSSPQPLQADLHPGAFALTPPNPSSPNGQATAPRAAIPAPVPALPPPSPGWERSCRRKGCPGRGTPARLSLFLEFFFSNARPSSCAPALLFPDRKGHILPQQNPAAAGARRRPHGASLGEEPGLLLG